MGHRVSLLGMNETWKLQNKNKLLEKMQIPAQEILNLLSREEGGAECGQD